MLTNERKEQLLDQILDLMTAVAYDREPNVVTVPSTAKAPRSKCSLLRRALS